MSRLIERFLFSGITLIAGISLAIVTSKAAFLWPFVVVFLIEWAVEFGRKFFDDGTISKRLEDRDKELNLLFKNIDTHLKDLQSRTQSLEGVNALETQVKQRMGRDY